MLDYFDYLEACGAFEEEEEEKWPKRADSVDWRLWTIGRTTERRMEMEIGQTKIVPVQAKTLSIHCKVSDMFTAQILDEQGVVLDGQDDGDYVILDIDIDTGQITNWKVPTAEQIQNFINQDQS